MIFAPILALARSGTTFLSSLLHRSDAVAGVDQYPYETRLGVHLAKGWFSSMQPRFYESHPGPNSEGMDQNLLAMLKIFEAEPGIAAARLGPFIEAAARQCRNKIVDLYKMLSARPAARVIVEKIGLKLELNLVRNLFDTRPIFLLRDPRDVLLSMRVFNQRRGIYDFHQLHAGSFRESLFSMSANLKLLAEYHDGYRGEKILVRYEDLVRDPAGVLQQILVFIGVAGSAGDVMRMVEQATIHKEHITAASPAASVGRWQDEMTSSEQAEINWFLKPFLDRFGY
ncbi:MAG: sulfotransferase domain-containing protein [Rudaea sp.]|nr:sulfotransferase domain-containing protein [Rudaea sp.]